jgi:16S rRNA (adenine1518-N6/adenine1519-N6)-dimethyltransferase
MGARRLGQHFLRDRDVAARIAELLAIEPGESVLEIGGGRGALTEHLVGRGARLAVAELDDALADRLEARFGAAVEVLRGDVLDLSLAALGGDERWVVAGNLPYYATSPIVAWLCEQWRHVARAALMMQLEVAERLVAPPGSRVIGRMSVLVQLRATARIVLRVQPGSFLPPPNVQSAVVRFDFHQQPAADVGDEGAFFSLVEQGFRHRRKTLAAALTMTGAGTRGEVDGWLAAAEVDGRRRAETLELAEWARLNRAREAER